MSHFTGPRREFSFPPSSVERSEVRGELLELAGGFSVLLKDTSAGRVLADMRA